jgi:glutamate-1-semialdehyde 2,1-aminomutase
MNTVHPMNLLKQQVAEEDMSVQPAQEHEIADTTKCAELLSRARGSLAGGDSSTMRVLPYHIPLVASRGEGCQLWDADDNKYVDLNMAYGPLIFGHRPPVIVDRVCAQMTNSGSQLGFPTEITTRVAEKIKILFPSMELLRFANSGTEAIASAVRLARTVTGRSKIILFEGHYHGWSDAVFNRYHAPLEELPESGFGAAIPGTTGMNGAPHDVIVVRWNDKDALDRCLQEHGDSVAACMMEPIMGNAGVIPPDPGYLQELREATLDRDILLIFDEVITGLRVAAGGAQEHFQVVPDITIISKALGGGFPVAAFGASREIMDVIVRGELFHGGVYSGNALVMSAAEAVLDTIIADGDEIYRHLHSVSVELAGGIRDVLTRRKIAHVVQHVGPLLSMFLTSGEVDKLTNYREVRRHCDFEGYIQLQHKMQRSGVYFHPNQFEPMFLSTAHQSSDIAVVLERLEDAVR